MTEDASPVHDDDERPWLPDWEEEPETGGHRRWLTIAVLGVLPWVAVAVLVLRGDGDAGPREEAATEAGAAQPVAPTATPSPGVGPTAGPDGSEGADPAAPVPEAVPGAVAGAATAEPGDGPGDKPGDGPGDGPATVIDGGAGDAVDLGEAVATASIVARAWLGGVGPPLEAGGVAPAAEAYVDHLAVSGVEHPAPGHAVVSLVAVLLHPAEDGYERTEVRALAVPVALGGDHARPAGAPWWLPAPPLERAEPDRRPVDDEGLLAEAGAALGEAGYRDVAVEALGAAGDWALIATASGVAPGEDEPAVHEVWLRRHLSRLVVAGHTGAGDGDTTTTEARR